ncbi:MAG: hypothetical protein KA369_20270 [Spirochaetes bacterium]|nr:hypothetical protein [Spirochaetota bacterium]
MLQKNILAIAWVALTLFTASRAMAFGIGAYATVGGGGSTYKTTTEDYLPNITGTSSDLTAGAGLILDTTLAQDSLFNYRLKIGGGRNWIDREKHIILARLQMSNIFGFGIIRTDIIRWWIGPQLGGTYSWGDRGKRNYAGIAKESSEYQALRYGVFSINDINLLAPYHDTIREINYGGLNVGLSTGLNINIGSLFTISLETGFKYNLNWGNQQRKIYETLWPLYEINHFTENLFVHGWELYGEIAFLFRIPGDNYRG